MPYRRTPRVHEKLEATRERILSSAHRLVAEGGYGSVRIQKIAEVAGVATGSVYRHFPSKSALFAEVFRRASAREIEAVVGAATRAGLGSRQKIAVAIETFARRALAGRRLAYALLAEPVDAAVETERLNFRRAYRDLFALFIRQGIERGEFAPQDPKVTAAGITGATGEALVGPLAAGDADPDGLVASIVSFCVRSLGEATHVVHA